MTLEHKSEPQIPWLWPRSQQALVFSSEKSAAISVCCAHLHSITWWYSRRWLALFSRARKPALAVNAAYCDNTQNDCNQRLTKNKSTMLLRWMSSFFDVEIYLNAWWYKANWRVINWRVLHAIWEPEFKNFSNRPTMHRTPKTSQESPFWIYVSHPSNPSNTNVSIRWKCVKLQ